MVIMTHQIFKVHHQQESFSSFHRLCRQLYVGCSLGPATTGDGHESAVTLLMQCIHSRSPEP